MQALPQEQIAEANWQAEADEAIAWEWELEFLDAQARNAALQEEEVLARQGKDTYRGMKGKFMPSEADNISDGKGSFAETGLRSIHNGMKGEQFVVRQSEVIYKGKYINKVKASGQMSAGKGSSFAKDDGTSAVGACAGKGKQHSASPLLADAENVHPAADDAAGKGDSQGPMATVFPYDFASKGYEYCRGWYEKMLKGHENRYLCSPCWHYQGRQQKEQQTHVDWVAAQTANQIAEAAARRVEARQASSAVWSSADWEDPAAGRWDSDASAGRASNDSWHSGQW